jgi:hypothetical protein
MIHPSSAASRPIRLANRKASPFSKQSVAHAFRVMAPILVALTFASAAHAQGTMDFSGAQTTRIFRRSRINFKTRILASCSSREATRQYWPNSLPEHAIPYHSKNSKSSSSKARSTKPGSRSCKGYGATVMRRQPATT